MCSCLVKVFSQSQEFLSRAIVRKLTLHCMNLWLDYFCAKEKRVTSRESQI